MMRARTTNTISWQADDSGEDEEETRGLLEDHRCDERIEEEQRSGGDKRSEEEGTAEQAGSANGERQQRVDRRVEEITQEAMRRAYLELGY